MPEAVYCFFKRTTLFTTMFTVIIMVHSLKSLCIPSFVYCPYMSYRNVWPEAIYTRTTLFTTFLYDLS